jgi:hypothetical protein
VRRASVRESQLSAGGGDGSFGINWILARDATLGAGVMHVGDNGQHTSAIWLLPARGLGVVVLSANDRADVSQALARLVLEAIVPPAPKLSAPVETALGRVQELLERPSVAALPAAIEPAFLAQVGPQPFFQLLDGLHRQAGHCTQRVVEQAGADTAEVRLQCEQRSIAIRLHVQAAPPHLVDGLFLQPVE